MYSAKVSLRIRRGGSFVVNSEFELIRYNENLPARIELRQGNINTPYHWHKEIELVYVMDGSLKMVSVKYTYNNESFTGTMTRLPNSNIWTIDVPGDLNAITFVGDNGNNTGSLTIPWTNAKPKYTAGSNPADPSNGGTWGNYIARSNEVDVTAGSTVTDGVASGKLFAGITATMYDYYVDGEVDSGANKWLNGILPNMRQLIPSAKLRNA